MNNIIVTKFKLAYPCKTKAKVIAQDLTFQQARPIAALIKGAVIKFDRFEVLS